MSDSESSPDPGPAGFTAPGVEELNARLPQFEFIEQIGLGGMGAVYKARQPKLNRFVAIKILPRVENDDFGFAERFEREAQSMARLSHPHIVPVYDFGETDDGQLYIVMEYVEGADLHQLIHGGQLTPAHFFSWIPQVCSALEYAHDHGIVHRDIKPANILINLEGQVRVADFGLAKLTSSDRKNSSLTHKSLSMGTPDYAAPEQIDAEREVDGRADIYALGVVIFQMITGKVPRGAFRNPSEENPAYDAKIDAVVLKAMQSDPADRYQHATEISTALEKIHHRPANDTAAIPVAALAPEKNPYRLIGLAAIITVSLVAIIAIIMAMNPSTPSPPADKPVSGTEPSAPKKVEPPTRPETEPERRPGKASSKPESESRPAPEQHVARTSSAKPTPTPPPSPAATKPSPKPDKKPTPPAANSTPAGAPKPPLAGDRIPNKPMRRMFAKRLAEPRDPNQPSPDKPALAETPEEEIPAEVAEVQARFEELFAATVEAPYAESVANLDQFYLNYLDSAEAAAQASAALDDLVALRAERQRIEAHQPMPEVDADDTPAELAARRAVYREQVAGFEAARSAEEHQLGQAYLDKLDSIRDDLTREGKTDEALAVRAFRDRFAANHSSAETLTAESPDTTTEPAAASEARAAGRRVVTVPAGDSTALSAAFADQQAGDFILLEPGTFPRISATTRAYALREAEVTLYGQRSDIENDLIAVGSDITVIGVRTPNLDIGTLDTNNVRVDVVVEACRVEQITCHNGSRSQIRNSIALITLEQRARTEIINCTIVPTDVRVVDQPALIVGADTHVDIEASIITSPGDTIHIAADGPTHCTISDSVVTGIRPISIELEDGSYEVTSNQRRFAELNIELENIDRTSPRFVAPESGDFRTTAAIADSTNQPPTHGAFIGSDGWPIIATPSGTADVSVEPTTAP